MQKFAIRTRAASDTSAKIFAAQSKREAQIHVEPIYAWLSATRLCHVEFTNAMTSVTSASVNRAEFTQESHYIAHVVLLSSIPQSNAVKFNQLVKDLARKSLTADICVLSNAILEDVLLV